MKTQRSLLISPFLTPCIFLSTSDCTDDSQQPEVQTLSCVLNYSWIFLFGSSVCTFAFICSPESWVYWSISHSQLWTTRWDRMKWTSSVRLLFKAGVWTRNMLSSFTAECTWRQVLLSFKPNVLNSCFCGAFFAQFCIHQAVLLFLTKAEADGSFLSCRLWMGFLGSCSKHSRSIFSDRWCFCITASDRNLCIYLFVSAPTVRIRNS